MSAAPCKWTKLSGHIRTSNFDCFWKSVKTMLFTPTIWMLTVKNNVYNNNNYYYLYSHK